MLILILILSGYYRTEELSVPTAILVLAQQLLLDGVELLVAIAKEPLLIIASMEELSIPELANALV